MNVIMPQMGETVEEGTVVKWLKNVGDAVSTQDIILEIETDKVGMEVPAPVDGVLSVIHVQEGETVAVGAILAEVNSDSETSAIGADSNVEQSEKESEIAAAEPATVADVPTSQLESTSEAIKPEGFDAQGPLSPIVKKLLSENKLDPSKIVGSGKDGRLKRDDILAHLASNIESEKTEAEAGRSNLDSSELIAFSKLRKKTAEHMVRSKAVSPHVLQAVEVDFHMVDQARQKFAEKWKSAKGFSLR